MPAGRLRLVPAASLPPILNLRCGTQAPLCAVPPKGAPPDGARGRPAFGQGPRGIGPDRRATRLSLPFPPGPYSDLWASHCPSSGSTLFCDSELAIIPTWPVG